MDIMKTKFFADFLNVTEDGVGLGWHERNGGNLSYRLSPDDVDEIRDQLLPKSEWLEIDASVPDLKNEYFLITGSGKFFRNISIQPEENCGIIQVDEAGERYRICWGLLNGARPTSELPTHLLNHEVKKRVSSGRNRVIYHAHTTNIIALTFVLPLDSRVITRYLWEMSTECAVVFPDGVGIVPWMVPGGRSIGVESSKLMEKFDIVIWAHHGTFCAGSTFDEAFGLMHTAEKSAEILIKVFSTQRKIQQTITPQDFRDLAEHFHVVLPEEFLYDRD
ncbi:MAG: rhamnulose-1-phosphate aldolase [Tissierellia bacterium]|nr:rhamnulose-1-phosphate aldolase [Tissierellia bacterium]